MTNAQERARAVLASLHREQYIDDRTDMEWKYQHNVTLVAAALAQVEAETYMGIESLAGLNCKSEAISEYGIGYQNAMKEISIYCELKLRQQAQRVKEEMA